MVCHRGCELFTVAFISTPRGGVSLVGPKPGVIPEPIMATLDENGIPLGPALFPVYKKKLASLNTTRDEVMKMKMDRAKKQKDEIEKKIASNMDGVAKVSMRSNERNYKMNLIKKIEEEKQKKQHELEALLKETLKDKHVKKSGSALDKSPKKTTDQKVSPKKTSKNNFRQVINVKPNNIHVQKVSRPLTSAHHQVVYTGEKAREILEQGRHPHGPSPVKEVHDSHEVHSPVHKKEEKSPSKTTVQPIHHPVQDHPVHANRQITTDSSDDRKTTTPKSANPLAKQIHIGKINQMGNAKEIIHPLLAITFMKPKPKTHVEVVVPQTVSIIEIVKKKNNIDFERLHQEHMAGAALCPMINDRLEQAKQSCRHGKSLYIVYPINSILYT